MKLVIDRNRWLRGEASESYPSESYLLRSSDGKMCCLGFLALACGARPEDITNVRTPDQALQACSWPAGLIGSREFEDRCDDLMNSNDESSLRDDVRERIISERMAEIGVEVEFVGGEDGHDR